MKYSTTFIIGAVTAVSQLAQAAPTNNHNQNGNRLVTREHAPAHQPVETGGPASLETVDLNPLDPLVILSPDEVFPIPNIDDTDFPVELNLPSASRQARAVAAPAGELGDGFHPSTRTSRKTVGKPKATGAAPVYGHVKATSATAVEAKVTSSANVASSSAVQPAEAKVTSSSAVQPAEAKVTSSSAAQKAAVVGGNHPGATEPPESTVTFTSYAATQTSTVTSATKSTTTIDIPIPANVTPAPYSSEAADKETKKAEKEYSFNGHKYKTVKELEKGYKEYLKNKYPGNKADDKKKEESSEKKDDGKKEESSEKKADYDKQEAELLKHEEEEYKKAFFYAHKDFVPEEVVEALWKLYWPFKQATGGLHSYGEKLDKITVVKDYGEKKGQVTVNTTIPGKNSEQKSFPSSFEAALNEPLAYVKNRIESLVAHDAPESQIQFWFNFYKSLENFQKSLKEGFAHYHDESPKKEGDKKEGDKKEDGKKAGEHGEHKADGHKAYEHKADHGKKEGGKSEYSKSKDEKNSEEPKKESKDKDVKFGQDYKKEEGKKEEGKKEEGKKEDGKKADEHKAGENAEHKAGEHGEHGEHKAGDMKGDKPSATVDHKAPAATSAAPAHGNHGNHGEGHKPQKPQKHDDEDDESDHDDDENEDDDDEEEEEEEEGSDNEDEDDDEHDEENHGHENHQNQQKQGQGNKDQAKGQNHGNADNKQGNKQQDQGQKNPVEPAHKAPHHRYGPFTHDFPPSKIQRRDGEGGIDGNNQGFGGFAGNGGGFGEGYAAPGQGFLQGGGGDDQQGGQGGQGGDGGQQQVFGGIDASNDGRFGGNGQGE